MASICVNYLLLNELDFIRLKKVPQKKYFSPDRLEIQRVTDEEHRNDIYDVEALLAYAAEHWPSHFRESTTYGTSPDLKKVCSLYQLECSRFKLWFPLLWQARRPYESKPDMNDIRLAAFNGHSVILHLILDSDSVNLENRDNKQRTALYWAAELGYEKVVKLLLDNGADVNA